jgi:hypothetical protein
VEAPEDYPECKANTRNPCLQVTGIVFLRVPGYPNRDRCDIHNASSPPHISFIVKCAEQYRRVYVALLGTRGPCVGPQVFSLRHTEQTQHVRPEP